jgi:hypothetical protein
MIDVFRLERDIANKITRMVERHEDHGEPTDHVDGGDSSTALIGNWEPGVLHGNLLCRP